MNIYTKIGIGHLKFGMAQGEVVRLLGKPNKTITPSDDEYELIWEYVDLKLRLSFYQNENARLAYIRSSNPHLNINGFKLIDRDIQEVKDHIDTRVDAWEQDNYDFFTTYFHEEYWLTLSVEYEKITSIELGVTFKNENEYNWPK